MLERNAKLMLPRFQVRGDILLISILDEVGDLDLKFVRKKPLKDLVLSGGKCISVTEKLVSSRVLSSGDGVRKSYKLGNFKR